MAVATVTAGIAPGAAPMAGQAVAGAGSSEDLWQRLSGLRLRLRDTIDVHALEYRGRPWYLLRDGLSGQQFRLSRAVYAVLADLDGRRTLAQAWQRHAGHHEGFDGNTDDLLNALMQLQAAGMLDAGPPTDAAALVARQQRLRRQQGLARWLRLLSPRLPLVEPDGFLTRSLPLAGWVFHPRALWLWLLVALGAGLQALMHWPALTLYGAQRLDDPRSWLLLIAVYPLVKTLHEIGHGLAAKRAGAEVNEMGITLLVFLPVPYVDASAASALRDKSQRMLVSAAGILVEGVLAALAMFAWLSLDDGLLREAMFAVMLIGGISTLLFNGNPLLRFDGYYVLSDAIEIPNLTTRAARYWGYLARRYLLGLGGERSPANVTGERRWFLFYGAASTVYRLMISLGIALFLIATVPTLGVLLAAWLIAAQVLLPLGRQLRFLLFSPTLTGRRLRALSIVGSLVFGILGVIALVPFPSSTKADGVVLLPERAIVRAGVDGFLARQLVAYGSPVDKGDPLFVLSNRELERDLAVLRARIAELKARRDKAGFEDRLAREIQAERLAELRAELAELERRHAGLVLRSPSAGVLRSPALGDGLGRLVAQGELLGYVADDAQAMVRVIAVQADAARIRDGVAAVQVRLADRASDVLSGELLGEVPAASDVLPSAALGSRAGGAIPVDARDPQGRQTLHKVFAFDIAVPFTQALQFIGSRAYVRFEHTPVPLLARGYDSVRRLVMSEIGE